MFAFVCLDGILQARRKYALKTYIWGTRRGTQNHENMLATLHGTRSMPCRFCCMVACLACLRGAAARFYLFPLRVFCFSSLCLAFLFFLVFVCFFLWHSAFLSFVCYYFLLPCFPLLACFLSCSFSFLCFSFVRWFSFFALLYSCILVSYIYIYNNKINIYSIYFVCVCVRTRVRTWSGETRHKKRAAQKEPLHMLS